MNQNTNFIVGPNDTVVLPESDYHAVPIVEASGDTLDETYRELVAFAETHNVSLARAADHYLAPADDSDPDLVVDVLERNGVKLFGDHRGPATSTEPVFSNRALAAFATSYIQDCYFYQIHDAAFWRIGKPFVPAFQSVHHSQQALSASFAKDVEKAFRNIAEFAGVGGGDSRSSLPDQYNAFNPPDVGSIMPEKVLYQDMEIADITGDVREISGSKYTAPKVTEPVDYKLTGIGEFGTIPKWRTGVGEDQVETAKAGYSQECSYEFLRTGGETMEGLAQFAMWLAFLTTAEIVDEGIALTMSSGGKTHAVGAATFTTKSAIKMLADKTRGVQYNVVVGNLDFFVEYASADITFKSNNYAPLTFDDRSRVFLNTPMGRQQITWRDGTEVSGLAGNVGKASLWDLRFVLRYILERNSNIEEQDIERGEQYISFYRTFNYVWQLMQMADDARSVASLS